MGFEEIDGASGLHAGVWTPEGRARATIVAVHGITSSHKAWVPLVRALPDVRIVAPDLRGRGGSRALPGPWGMARHADDVAGLLAELGVDEVVAVGHSMGGFVVLNLAHRHPAVVSRLVLVDGGLPLMTDPTLAPQESLQRTLGPAAERLSRTFGSREEYRAFWRQHPAFASAWSPDVEDYVDYDLVDAGEAWQPATSYEAMASDSRDLITPGNDTAVALGALAVPTTFLRAERGMVDEPGGLYPADWVAQAAGHPLLTVRDVPDVNHYTITLSPQGADAVAQAVREAVGAPC